MMHDTSHGRWHVVLIVLGCLLPLAGLAAVYLFGTAIPRGLMFGLLLLCPLGHLLMMALLSRQQQQPPATELAEKLTKAPLNQS